MVSSFRASQPTALLLPSMGHWDPVRGAFRIEIEGWVHHGRSGSLRRKVASRLMRQVTGLPRRQATATVVRDRLRAFAVENLAGVTVHVEILGHIQAMPASGSNGRFSGELWIEPELLGTQLPQTHPIWLQAHVARASVDCRKLDSRVQLLPRRGVVVVCDIDDTIKISGVGHKRRLLANTFARPYQEVPGMAEILRAWQRDGAAFVYLSNSPIPLYGPLSEFMTRVDFPPGVWQLREFSLRDRSFLQVLDAAGHKHTRLGHMLAHYHGQEFIFVGDTGERDPETYVEIAAAYPGRVRAIMLREHPDFFLDPRRQLKLQARAGGTRLYWFRDAGQLRGISVVELPRSRAGNF